MCKPGQKCGGASIGRGAFMASSLGGLLDALREHMEEQFQQPTHAEFMDEQIRKAKLNIKSNELIIALFEDAKTQGRDLICISIAGAPDASWFYSVVGYADAAETTFEVVGQYHGRDAERESFVVPSHDAMHAVFNSLREKLEARAIAEGEAAIAAQTAESAPADA